jgi:adenylylsulfate kinase-like enzyme
MVYFITGKANAGKTTLANKLKKNYSAILLDGDDIRSYFPTGYSDNERYKHIIHMSKIAAMLESQGYIVIIAAIMPKRIWREDARKNCKETKLIYMPGGFLWKDTIYEEPHKDEFKHDYDK